MPLSLHESNEDVVVHFSQRFRFKYSQIVHIAPFKHVKTRYFLVFCLLEEVYLVVFACLRPFPFRLKSLFTSLIYLFTTIILLLLEFANMITNKIELVRSSTRFCYLLFKHFQCAEYEFLIK